MTMLCHHDERYLDDALLGFLHQFDLEFAHHLRVDDHGECPLHGHAPLVIPLLHVFAELILHRDEGNTQTLTQPTGGNTQTLTQPTGGNTQTLTQPTGGNTQTLTHLQGAIQTLTH